MAGKRELHDASSSMMTIMMMDPEKNCIDMLNGNTGKHSSICSSESMNTGASSSHSHYRDLPMEFKNLHMNDVPSSNTDIIEYVNSVTDEKALAELDSTDSVSSNVVCQNSCQDISNFNKESCSRLALEKGKDLSEACFNKADICAICHDKIKTEETAQIRGCEHSYCVTCILRWACYKPEPWCPQCRLPFSFLYVYRALDGTLSDYMFEESVCLLLRASWFKPLVVQEPEEPDDYQDDYDIYEEPYYLSNVRLGNRRWGDSGYVRTGRREARPVGVRQVIEPSCNGSSSSRQAKSKEPAKPAVGRRARRAQKREQMEQMNK